MFCFLPSLMLGTKQLHKGGTATRSGCNVGVESDPAFEQSLIVHLDTTWQRRKGRSQWQSSTKPNYMLL